MGSKQKLKIINLEKERFLADSKCAKKNIEIILQSLIGLRNFMEIQYKNSEDIKLLNEQIDEVLQLREMLDENEKQQKF